MRALRIHTTMAAVLMLALAGTTSAASQDGVATATPEPANPAPAHQPSKGQLVAIAGDCAGCHAARDGSSKFSGGVPIASPMGNIYARNITPDAATGIGGWTYDDFVSAMRNGKSKKLGHLFPAMPYASYKYVSEEDMRALYDFLMNEVEPVNHEVPQTNLGFPFVRPAMVFWNMLFANNGKPEPLANADAKVIRGKYLVETLGHCGECHTPRGMLMQLKGASHRLSGGDVGGWYAPNITSDASGIGRMSDEDLRTFLATGKTRSSIAGGDMNDAIERSLSKMPAADIDAIVAYLKASKPVKTAMGRPVQQNIAPLNIIDVEPTVDIKTSYDSSTTNGSLLYTSACASCHGVNGELASGARPSLIQNNSVRAPQPNNVVQAISYGIDLRHLDTQSLMPSFKSSLNDAQIAAVASYVRGRFGGISDTISAKDVTRIRTGHSGVSWLLLNARWLAWFGIAALLVALAAGVPYLLKRPKRSRA